MPRGLWIILLVMVVFSGGFSEAGDVPETLFAAYSGPLEVPTVDQSLVPRQRLVVVRPDSIRMEPGSSVLLNLFDDVRVEAVCVSADREVLGSRIWQGRGTDTPPAKVILAVGGRTISGEVHVHGRVFHIRPLDDDAHVIREVVFVSDLANSSRTRQAPLNVEWDNAGLVNQERRINGLHDLAWDDKLRTAAREHSGDMAARNYFAHASLDGRNPGDRITAAGYVWNAYRENIAVGQTTPVEVHQAWMNSPGHRKNILDSVICDIGVGYVHNSASQYRHYWTQNFGRKHGLSTCPAVADPPLPGAQPSPDPQPEVLNNLGWANAFYVAYWGRSPDPEGLAYWMDMINSGRLNVSQVAEVFAMSDEARAVYAYFHSPSKATDAQRADFVRAVYINLLNRHADTTGLNYWVDVLRTGASTPGLVIGNIINAAMAAGSTDWLIIRNKVEVANYFAWRFEQKGYVWNENARNAAVEALKGLTSDPATVTARKAWIDQLMP
ncbi:CAP domain-containing protein [Desulfonatronum parangueonense]